MGTQSNVELLWGTITLWGCFEDNSQCQSLQGSCCGDTSHCGIVVGTLPIVELLWGHFPLWNCFGHTSHCGICLGTLPIVELLWGHFPLWNCFGDTSHCGIVVGTLPTVEMLWGTFACGFVLGALCIALTSCGDALHCGDMLWDLVLIADLLWRERHVVGNTALRTHGTMQKNSSLLIASFLTQGLFCECEIVLAQ